MSSLTGTTTPPNVEELEKELSESNLAVHIWRRTEIENYLLNGTAIRRLLRGRGDQMVVDEQALQAEFDRLIESSRGKADDGLVQAFDEVRKRQRERWDAATMNRMAREYLDGNWNDQRIELADAKSVVLPGIKRWLQEHRLGAFSDHKLAETFVAEDLPPEVHQLAQRLVVFSGLR